MSESENLNFDPHSNGGTQNAEQILRELQLQPLEINRDELFFQAGFAAGRRGRAVRYFWPSTVAALLLVCVGLGAMLAWQAGSISTLQTALAATQPTSTSQGTLANLAQSALVDSRDIAVVDGNHHSLAHDQLRQWQCLASPAPLPPGQLTAMGWVEIPREMRNGQQGTGGDAQQPPSEPSVEPESAPHHPATYWELMHLQREG
jgi:hypothetical protein